MRQRAPYVIALIFVACIPAHAGDFMAYSGEQLYQRFCASCHGMQARGDGPVAASLSVEVPDLRLIARRHGGTFPADLVERIIDGRHVLAAHGTRTMPVWGEELARSEPGNPDAEKVTRIVIGRLVDYLWRLQLTLAEGR